MITSNTVTLLKKINLSILLIVSTVLFLSFLAKRPKVEKALNDLTNLEVAFAQIDSTGRSSHFNEHWLKSLLVKKLREDSFNLDKKYCFKIDGETVRLTCSPWFYRPLQEVGPHISTYTLSSIKNYWNSLNKEKFILTIKFLESHYASYDSTSKSINYKKLLIIPEDSISQFSVTTRLQLVDVTKSNWVDEFFPEFKRFSEIRTMLTKMVNKPNISTTHYLIGNKTVLFNATAFDFNTPGQFAVANNWQNYEYSIVAKALEDKLFFPVHLGKIRVDPINEIILNVPQSFQWRHGSFRYNFKELDDFTEGFQDIPIEKLKLILSRDLKSSFDAVNLFGVKLPYEIIKRFGILVLIFAQIYFLVYLNYLLQLLKVEPEVETPWMLLHTSNLSKIVFVLSSILYPLLSTLVLFIKNLNEMLSSVGNLSWSILLISLEIFITFLIYKKVKNIFRVTRISVKQ